MRGVVWAEITGTVNTALLARNADDVLAMWDDEWDLAGGDERRYHVELGDVPTDLLLAAKSHVDNLVRESTLASAGARAGQTAEVLSHLASLLSAVVERFVDVPASEADAAEEYIRALDEVDAYCRARRMLTLESAPQHQVFRHWYIEELVTHLRAAAAGRPTPPGQSFERPLLAELDRVSVARRAAERTARLYAVAAALATAATPEEVAEAVLSEGVAALGASGGGVLLVTDAEHLILPGAVGYDETVLARLRTESRHAELPAAVALRTTTVRDVTITLTRERSERWAGRCSRSM